MSKVYDPKKLPISEKVLEESSFYNKLDVSALVFRQIERTNNSATLGEDFFASNVRLLMSLVPSYKRDEILDRSNEYMSEVESLEYKRWCGVPLGTPEHPINGSPYPVKTEVIDWHKLNEIVLDVLEDCGVTWKQEPMTVEVGAVEKNVDAPPTPLFASDETETIPQQEVIADAKEKTPKGHPRPCAICGEHCAPGTSKFFGVKPNRKQVHIKDCWALAEIKWKNGVPENDS